MSLKFGFFNSQLNGYNQPDRVYDANDISSLFDGLITGKGVYYHVGERFKVEPGPNQSAEVIVKPGRAWHKHIWVSSDNNIEVNLPSPHASFDRIDALCLYFNTSSREVSFAWIKGTADYEPNKPNVDASAYSDYLVLAFVRRRASVLYVTTADIEQAVGSNKRTKFITSVLKQEDLSSYWNQWNAQFTEWFEDAKQSYYDWIADQNSLVSKTQNGLCPQLPSGNGTTKFLRQDATWANIVFPTLTTAVMQTIENQGGSWQNGGTELDVTYNGETNKFALQATGDVSITGVSNGKKIIFSTRPRELMLVSQSEAGFAPAVTNTNGFLKGDGTWYVPSFNALVADTDENTGGTWSNGSTELTLSHNSEAPNVIKFVSSGDVSVKGTFNSKKITVSSKPRSLMLVSASEPGYAPAITNTAGFLKGDGTWVDPNNNKVNQTVTTGNANYELLFAYSSGTPATGADGTRRAANLTYNPSTGNLNVSKINGVTVGSNPNFSAPSIDVNVSDTIEPTGSTIINGDSIVRLDLGGGALGQFTIEGSGEITVRGSQNNKKITIGNKPINHPIVSANAPGYAPTVTNTANFLKGDGTWATPANNKVAQTVTTNNATYEVLFSNSTGNSTATEGARKNNNLTFNPSTGNLQTTKLNGVTVGSSPAFTDSKVRQIETNGDAEYSVLFGNSTASNASSALDITDGARKQVGFTYNPFSGNLSVMRINGKSVDEGPYYAEKRKMANVQLSSTNPTTVSFYAGNYDDPIIDVYTTDPNIKYTEITKSANDTIAQYTITFPPVSTAPTIDVIMIIRT